MREGKGIREGNTFPLLFLVTEITFHVTYLGQIGELVKSLHVVAHLWEYISKTWGYRKGNIQ